MIEALKDPSAWAAMVSFAAMVISIAFSLAGRRSRSGI